MQADPIKQFTDTTYLLKDDRADLDAEAYFERKVALVKLRRKALDGMSEEQQVRFGEMSLALLLFTLGISPSEVSAIESQLQPPPTVPDITH